MLLAYLDEVGEPGPFVSKSHPKYNTSSAFGYAGFIIPDQYAVDFSAYVAKVKRDVFLAPSDSEQNLWERKGAQIFRPGTVDRFPYQLRAFNAMVGRLVSEYQGRLFYYVDEKHIGTPKQTNWDSENVEVHALTESLNRIARFADSKESNVLVMMDQVNEKTRMARIHQMYGHIYGRMKSFKEMGRLVESPMHVDSLLSNSIQFADWVASFTGRAIDYQLIEDSAHYWVTDSQLFRNLIRSFTFESKLHLFHRSVEDISQGQILLRERRLYPTRQMQTIGSATSYEFFNKIHAASVSLHSRESGARTKATD